MSTTDNKTTRKTVSKKKTAARKKATTKKATTKKTAVRKKATAKQKTTKTKSQPDKTTDVKGLHPVLPYAIAATFIFLTAGLTMLMTSLLGETSDAIKSLEDATDGVQKSPSLLAEARESFATPTTATPQPVINTTPVVKTPAPALAVSSKNDTITQTADKVPAGLVSTEDPKSISSHVTDNKATVLPAENAQIINARKRANHVFLTHKRHVAQIRQRIQENADRHEQQIEAYITAQIQAMNDEVERIETLLKPVAPPRAVETYQKMIDRRRESFQRMMEERNKLLQDIRKRRTDLRQRYTQLLREINQVVS